MYLIAKSVLGDIVMACQRLALLTFVLLAGCSAVPGKRAVAPAAVDDSVETATRLPDDPPQMRREFETLDGQVDLLQQQVDGSSPRGAQSADSLSWNTIPSEKEAEMLLAIANLERKHNDAFGDVLRSIKANRENSAKEIGEHYPNDVAKFIQGSRLLYENLRLLATCIYLRSKAKSFGSREFLQEIDAILEMNAGQQMQDHQNWSALTVSEGMMRKLVRETESTTIAAAARDELECARELRDLWRNAVSP